jgi:hypothetical protein
MVRAVALGRFADRGRHCFVAGHAFAGGHAVASARDTIIEIREGRRVKEGRHRLVRTTPLRCDVADEPDSRTYQLVKSFIDH